MEIGRVACRPDAVGWRRDKYLTLPATNGRGVVTAGPDWIAEVLSPSTARTTQHGRQAAEVPPTGVGHYWLVDPQNGTLTVLRWTEEDYLVVLSAGRGEDIRAFLRERPRRDRRRRGVRRRQGASGSRRAAGRRGVIPQFTGRFGGVVVHVPEVVAVRSAPGRPRSGSRRPPRGSPRADPPGPSPARPQYASVPKCTKVRGKMGSCQRRAGARPRSAPMRSPRAGLDAGRRLP